MQQIYLGLLSRRSDILLSKNWLDLLTAAQSSFGCLQCSCGIAELLGRLFV